MSTPAASVTANWGSAWRRPGTACAVALVAPLAFVRFGWTAHAFVVAFLLAVLVTLSVIDYERRILPNAIVLPAALIVLAAQIATDPGRTAEWLACAFGAAGALLVLSLVNPAGMGMGDVKLAFLLGAALGGRVVTAVLIASLSIWPVAVILFVKRGRAARGTAIAFGPFLAFGAIVAALIGG
jgi:leader peptidase (prepilin peptidase)/N-methyltransferase